MFTVSDYVFKTERNVEEDSSKERECDVNLSILRSVEPLEVGWFVDGDISVDGHEDDDIDRASHERVDDGNFEMSLVEG